MGGRFRHFSGWFGAWGWRVTGVIYWPRSIVPLAIWGHEISYLGHVAKAKIRVTWWEVLIIARQGRHAMEKSISGIVLSKYVRICTADHPHVSLYETVERSCISADIHMY